LPPKIGKSEIFKYRFQILIRSCHTCPSLQGVILMYY
jgi:hypothetical protein